MMFLFETENRNAGIDYFCNELNSSSTYSPFRISSNEIYPS